MTFEPPDFPQVTPASLDAACRSAVDRCDGLVAALLGVPEGRRTFANTVGALEEARQAVEETRWAWCVLAQVGPDPAVSAAAREWSTRLNARLNALDFDERVHAAVDAYAGGTREDAPAAGPDARLLEDVLTHHRRLGAGLPEEQRARLRKLFGELLELATAFRATLADWSDGIVVARDELDGLPEAFVAGLERVEGGYRVSLDYPQAQPFMAHARSAARRRELLVKERSKGGPENLARLERGLAARREIAALLGYRSYAAYRTETRMARSPERVGAFLEDLRERIAPRLAADRAQLAALLDGEGEPAPWDDEFAIARLKETSCAVDDAAVAGYFPLDACLEGLLGVTGGLLGLRFAEVPDAPVWHPDVRVLDVFDTGTDSGADSGSGSGSGSGSDEAMGRIHLDLFPRPGKFRHAMVTRLRQGRRLPDGTWQTPVDALVVNLTPPCGDRPSLLRHRELVTLFHEFGHALHSVLNRAEHPRFASDVGTEMDFVEAPSQMLEHWVWDPAVLRRLSRHHETGDPLPDSLLSGLIASRSVASALRTTRLLAHGALDLALHGEEFDGDVMATLREVYARYGVVDVDGTCFPAGWSHQFGGYDAGYYCYPWSRVIADDLFTRFEQAGPLDPTTGAAYRRAVLEPGGDEGATAMVHAFLGRAPDNAAYLRHLGLTSG